VTATLKLFDPDAEPKLIKPVRPYKPQNRIFAKKELSMRVMNALREADGAPLMLDDIAQRIIGDKGLESVAGAMVRRISAVALRSLQKRGIVTTEDRKRWAVKP